MTEVTPKYNVVHSSTVQNRILARNKKVEDQCSKHLGQACSLSATANVWTYIFRIILRIVHRTFYRQGVETFDAITRVIEGVVELMKNKHDIGSKAVVFSAVKGDFYSSSSESQYRVAGGSS